MSPSPPLLLGPNELFLIGEIRVMNTRLFNKMAEEAPSQQGQYPGGSSGGKQWA